MMQWTKPPIFILKIKLRAKQNPIRKLAPIFLFEFSYFLILLENKNSICLYNSITRNA